MRVGGGTQGVKATHMKSVNQMTYDQFCDMLRSILGVEIVDKKYTYAGKSYKIVEELK